MCMHFVTFSVSTNLLLILLFFMRLFPIMEHFSLRWNNFHRNMSSGLRTLLLEDSLVDVTLAADGHFVQAHRLVLSVCSPYFKELFSVNPCNHPIVILKDVKHKQLTDLLSFIYQGEVSVHQEDLPEFLKTAELLQIRGLADQNFDKGNAPATTDKATTSEHSVPLIPADAVSFGRGIRDQTDRNAGTSNVGCPEDRCNERAPCEVAATTLPIVTANGQSSNATCLHSEELPTSVLLGIPIKQEPPDAIVDFTHNTDVLESEEIQGREAQVEHEDISSAQVVLERMNHEELRECDERVMTESATDEGASRSRNSLIRERKAMENSSVVQGKMHRRQRKVALNKIRHFLVTPKRSRRIAFARKMKDRKHIIKKSVMDSFVGDVSKLLPADGTHLPSVKCSNISAVKSISNLDNSNKDFLESENISQLVLSINNTISKDTTVRDYQDHAVTSNQKVVKKMRKKTWRGSRKRKKVVSSASRNIKHLGKLRKEHVNVEGESSEPSQELRIADPHFETNSYNDNEESPISNDKLTTINNKKKMIVMIAAKKTKSAVALARKTKSNILLPEESIASKSLANKTDLAAAKSVRSGKSSKPDAEKPVTATGLRSNAPNGSIKDLTITNGVTCRHLGCVGCREDN